MKKIALLIAASALILLSACSEETKQPASEKETAQVEKPSEANEANKTEEKTAKATEDLTQNVDFEGVTFSLPASYKEVEQSKDGNVSYILYQIDGSASLNLVIEDASFYEDLTLESYLEMNRATTGYTYIEERYYEENGYRWNELVSTSNGFELHQSTVAKDGLFYTFTYGALPDEIDNHLEDIQNILSTVQLP